MRSKNSSVSPTHLLVWYLARTDYWVRPTTSCLGGTMSALGGIRAAVLGSLLAFGSTVWADPKVEEEVVGPNVQDAKYIVSPQGGHLATVARKGSRMMVTVDGVAGPKVDDVVTAATAYID